jgi:hypothetical protein
MMQSNLLPATPEDLVAAQVRLARAKDADDEAQADMRAARADATAAKKELKEALRGWRSILRQTNAKPAGASAEDDGPDDDEDDEDDEDAPRASDEPEEQEVAIPRVFR